MNDARTTLCNSQTPRTDALARRQEAEKYRWMDSVKANPSMVVPIVAKQVEDLFALARELEAALTSLSMVRESDPLAVMRRVMDGPQASPDAADAARWRVARTFLSEDHVDQWRRDGIPEYDTPEECAALDGAMDHLMDERPDLTRTVTCNVSPRVSAVGKRLVVTMPNGSSACFEPCGAIGQGIITALSGTPETQS